MGNHSTSVEPWVRTPLAYLIGGMPAEVFFDKYYENRVLHCRHDDGERYRGLLDIDRIDDILANSELPPKALDMARRDPPIQRSYFTYTDGSIDRGAVIHHFQRGATLILPQLHLADARLAEFCRALESVFSTRVQTNIYLTPGNGQGFGTHYDDHDVFVMQVRGQKRWRLYRRPLDNPYRGEKFRAGEYEPGEPVQEVLLQAGECVYVPRGLMHDAAAEGDTPSLHVTVGLLGRSWADLMLEALSEVALRDPRFRRSLPPGFADPDFDTGQAKAEFDELLDRFKQNASFEEAFEVIRENYLRARRPALQGGLVDACAAGNEETQYQRRDNIQVLLRHDDREAVLVSAGGDIHFDREALTGLRTALAGEPFGREAFTELSTDKAEENLQRLLAFGVIEKL